MKQIQMDTMNTSNHNEQSDQELVLSGLKLSSANTMRISRLKLSSVNTMRICLRHTPFSLSENKCLHDECTNRSA